jgi:hypothetical protein
VAIRVAAGGAGGIVRWVAAFRLRSRAEGYLRPIRVIEVTRSKYIIQIGHRMAFITRHRRVTGTFRQMVLMRPNAAEFGIAVAIQIEGWSGLQNTRVRGHDSIRVPVTGGTLIGLNGCRMVSIKATRSHQSLSRQKDELAHTEFAMLAFS